VKGARDGILNFKNKKNNPEKKIEDTEYFNAAGRPLKDLNRNELINTEKTLAPKEG
jgi:hypothetical protein